MHSGRPTDPVPGHHRAIEDTAADWLARRDGGRMTADDETALAAWLDAAIAHRVAFLRLQAAWEESRRLDALGAGLRGGRPPASGHWQASPWTTGTATPAPAQAPPAPDPGAWVFAPRAARPPRRRLPPAVAASVLVAGLGVALAWRWLALPPVDAVAHRTPLGDVATVPLADGSQTILASDSALTARLSRSERRIELQQGEAIFEAARDPGRPFVVAAGNRRVTAIGTRFSVRRDGADLRVVVTEGSVRLETLADGGDGAQPATVLPAGSVARAGRDGVLVRSVPLDEAARMLDWRSGLLFFRDAPLAEAAAEFNRYNARKIVIADLAAGQLRIGGSFRWENTESFVRLLEQGFPLRADYGPDRIVVRTRQET